MSRWLLVSYHAPTEPSALRVATWRALKQLGAVKLGDGLYFLPHTPECSNAVEALQQRIQGGGGDALVVTASGLGSVDEAFLSESFMAARTDEFAQVERWAQRLVEHIGREESTDDYRFAEVDTLEEEMEKLRRQFQRVTERDYLGSPARQTAATVLSEAARRLSAYVDEAFRKENGLSERSAGSPPLDAGS
jgi:ChrB-like protein